MSSVHSPPLTSSKTLQVLRVSLNTFRSSPFSGQQFSFSCCKCISDLVQRCRQLQFFVVPSNKVVSQHFSGNPSSLGLLLIWGSHLQRQLRTHVAIIWLYSTFRRKFLRGTYALLACCDFLWAVIAIFTRYDIPGLSPSWCRRYNHFSRDLSCLCYAITYTYNSRGVNWLFVAA